MPPTIVLIPGLMNDGAVWAGQVAALARIAPLFIASTDAFDSLGAMAADILARTTGPLAVIGHSMGGRVAVEVVAQAPARVVRLGLIDTAAGPVTDAERQSRRALVDLAHARGLEAVVASWLPPMMAPDADPAARAQMEAIVRRASPAILERQQTALLTRPDHEPALTAIACPTLIAAGRLDITSTPESNAALAARLPGSTLAIVEEAGHMLPVERPDALTELLVALIRG